MGKKFLIKDKNKVMKNIRRDIITIFSAALLVGALAGCHKKSQKPQEETPEIDVAEVMSDSVVLHRTIPGMIQSATTADVVARVNGQLLTCNFTPGTYVHKGQVLFTIEPTLYQNQLETATSSLANARSEYEYYSKQYAAMQKALEADAVSKMEVLQSKSSMEQAEAAIKSAEAAISTAKTNLGYCTVTAPVSGFISERLVDPGNYVGGAGAAVKLATIYDNTALQAVFSLSDAQYEMLVGDNRGIGSPLFRNVPLQFREPMDRQYTTDLYYTAPSIDTETGTVVIKGKLTNPDNKLKSGMYVTVMLPYDENPHAVLVKDASIGTDQRGKYLYVVNDSNKVVYTPIEAGGIYQDTLRVVNSGVKPGQRYVSKALLTVRNGETVKPHLVK